MNADCKHPRKEKVGDETLVKNDIVFKNFRYDQHCRDCHATWSVEEKRGNLTHGAWKITEIAYQAPNLIVVPTTVKTIKKSGGIAMVFLALLTGQNGFSPDYYETIGTATCDVCKAKDVTVRKSGDSWIVHMEK